MHQLKWGAIAALSLMAWLGTARQARCSDATGRLAVLIVVDGDPRLSDSLTEIAIAKLAEFRGGYMVGQRELREAFADTLSADGLSSCAGRDDCLARLFTTAGAADALLGVVRRDNDRFDVRLWLVSSRRSGPSPAYDRSVTAELGPLIAAIRAGVVALESPSAASVEKAPESAPRRALDPTPELLGRARPTLDLTWGTPASNRTESKRASRSWLVPYGYCAGGAAIVSLSASVVTGNLASATPVGATRAEAQTDLGRRDHYANIANGLLITGAALALSAAAALLWHWHHG